jgi:LysM domain
MQLQTIRHRAGQSKTLILLFLGAGLTTGCQSAWNPFHHRAAETAPVPITQSEPSIEGDVVGDNRTAMESATEGGSVSRSTDATTSGGPVMAPNAPDTYVVKRGDTLWGISKVFLRDPWYWPEIWQVNPQVQNPHLIYPGDTLRLVYIDGQPHIQLERGNAAIVSPRVRSSPLDEAIRSIPYEIVAAFMSKPSVLTKEDIKHAPYIFSALDHHVVMGEGDTLYARGFKTAATEGARYNVVRIGDALRDPDDNEVLGYDGIYTGTGRVTRGGDVTTLLLTESALESIAGDKLLSGNVDVPLDFVPSPPKVKVVGRIISIHLGVSVVGQYQVVVINRGVRDGLSPGNVLSIFKAGEKVPDRERSAFVHQYTMFAKDVRLPDERVGTFMVFKTFDRLSYGLIMDAHNTIHVLDRVENP